MTSKKKDPQKAEPRFFPHIIRSAGKIPKFIRIRDILLTLTLWCLYLYMLQGFFIFLGDVYRWLHEGDETARAYPKLHIFQIMLVYGKTIAIMAAIFIAWAQYNRMRFKNSRRRKNANPVQLHETCKIFRVDERDLKKWQNARSAVVTLSATGRLVDVETNR